MAKQVVSPVQGTKEATVLAVLCVGAETERWTSTIMSLVAARVEVLILTTGNTDAVARMHEDLPVRVENWSLSEAGAFLMNGTWQAGFIVTDPVSVPRKPFDEAIAALEEDIRICSVSFFSNNANYLSFPHRNAPSVMVVNGQNEHTITRTLRADTIGQRIVPIPVPAGSGILVSTLALRALGGFDGYAKSAEIALLDLALRGIQRGFRNVLDATTFIVRPLKAHENVDALNEAEARDWLQYRHHFFPTLYDYERDAPDTPLADSLALRRSSILGLRVLLDGSCLGPYEMGTQVAMLAQVDALIRHPGIRELVVATPDGQIPDYARKVLMQPGITVCHDARSTFPDSGQVDIIHRPFQASEQLPFAHWRNIARRVVVTIQDLIAYDNGNYHGVAENWLAYREATRDAAKEADAIVVISHDTANTVHQARLPLRNAEITVIENGTDHLTHEGADEQAPVELLESGMMSSEFILVLGASYSHKNRDLAIKAWHELRSRGHLFELVLAGVVVPLGSTRDQEALAASKGDWPITLPDVTTAERNWLLHHASAVLYPTSAEGFGLVPFEAAVFGTPTVFVGFGPLDEVLPDIPVVASEWSERALADALETVIRDSDVATRQVDAILEASTGFTWERYANKLVQVYRTTLARPASR